MFLFLFKIICIFVSVWKISRRISAKESTVLLPEVGIRGYNIVENVVFILFPPKIPEVSEVTVSCLYTSVSCLVAGVPHTASGGGSGRDQG